MKCLDTPVLLEILAGRPSAKKLLEELAGEELGTTEVNLFELAACARSLGPSGLEKRLAALERLRRSLSVLPVDERSSRLTAARYRDQSTQAVSGSSWLIFGALEAYGCTEWITSRSSRFPTVSTKIRIRRRPNI